MQKLIGPTEEERRAAAHSSSGLDSSCPAATFPLAQQSNVPQSSARFWPQELILGFLPLILGAIALFWATFVPHEVLPGGADFRAFYTGGYMLRTGHGKQLCDYEEQTRFENALMPSGTTYTLPIIHLPFEELYFVPLSFLSYRNAYWIFLALNCALVLVSLRLLKTDMLALSDRWRWFPALLFVAYYPISRALAQGQDSIIMLTLLAGALWTLDHDRELTTGLLIGAGVFKFQIVIPIAVLFLVWRRWKIIAGFLISSLPAGLISLWIVGFHGMREYVEILLGLSVRLSSSADVFHFRALPTAMLNVRGLATAMLGERLPHGAVQAVILATSIAVLWAAAKQKPSLQLAIMAASLVSYHFLTHDASILIIPISAGLCSKSAWKGAVAASFFFISILGIVPQLGYLGSIPLLALFFLSLRSPQQGAAASHGSVNPAGQPV